MKTSLWLAAFGALLAALACQSSPKETKVTPNVGSFNLHVPPGNAPAGRQAFVDMRCHACHRVEGESFPAPVATPDVPVVLGEQQARQSRAQLLESIIAPSCRIPEDLPDVRSGNLSRMGDYSDAMTVRQLLDLIAFIQSLPGKETPGNVGPDE